MTALVRPARFAGSWYPGDPVELARTIRAHLPAEARPAPARAVVVPHAGYIYSLGIAAETYARARIPSTAVVLCPNHTVPPPIISLWPSGAWQTPLGSVPVDEALAADILAECPFVEAEASAHLREHAIELQLPILQTLRPDVRVVALVVAHPSYETLAALGEGIARAVARHGDTLLVASTDMTHQEPAERARAKDALALERLLALDARGLLEVCERERITMCGVRPTTAVVVAAKALGAQRAELVRYGNSGETNGDFDRVVGYAGVVVR
ncbi:MAG: AmmeMemoRadiSam system protein B [Planctomycetota bacterium]|nr:MAG: AmmeMemoRadiSam system protein B [Planctomycetota bacterium]